MFKKVMKTRWNVRQAVEEICRNDLDTTLPDVEKNASITAAAVSEPQAMDDGKATVADANADVTVANTKPFHGLFHPTQSLWEGDDLDDFMNMLPLPSQSKSQLFNEIEPLLTPNHGLVTKSKKSSKLPSHKRSQSPQLFPPQSIHSSPHSQSVLKKMNSLRKAKLSLKKKNIPKKKLKFEKGVLPNSPPSSWIVEKTISPKPLSPDTESSNDVISPTQNSVTFIKETNNLPNRPNDIASQPVPVDVVEVIAEVPPVNITTIEQVPDNTTEQVPDNSTEQVPDNSTEQVVEEVANNTSMKLSILSRILELEDMLQTQTRVVNFINNEISNYKKLLELYST